MSEIQINRQYKDRLFKLIFREKKDLLQLYNAINNTDYDNPDDIEVNTLEDVVYMGMKNDISFLVKDVLNLYEHQSTFSPNLPLRGLLYFARLYQKIVGDRKDIYSRKIIELPFPQFVVFYNGTTNEPERQVLELSDAFPEWAHKEKAALACRAVVLNINLGYNKDIMEKCQKLREYAEFIAKVREYLDKECSITEAINKAVDECIGQGILEEILRNNREEVCSMLLTEYDEQAHINNEKELSYEEGREVGREEGLRLGRVEGECVGKAEGERLGRAEGLLLGKVQSILELLEELGPISNEVREKVTSETDAAKLQAWLKLAAKAESIEQFLQDM